MAALARSHGHAPHKPIWLEEFGASKIEMPETDIPRWMELAITGGVAQGISYFTWWASHNVSEKFNFNRFEYSLGLLTTDNETKEQGRTFKRLADSYRGKPVIIPDQPLPPPPTQRTDDTAWRWMLDWMKWKK